MTAVATSSGCQEEDNFLKGSAAESYDLSFDHTRARLYDSELSIEYVVGEDDSSLVTLRVTVDVAPGPLYSGTSVDLLSSGHVGRGDGFDAALPELYSGELSLLEYSGARDTAARGTFDAVFETTNGNLLTLRGGFDTTLEVVGQTEDDAQ